MESIPANLESLLRSLAGDALEENQNTTRIRHSSGQVMRLLLNAKRTEQGYRGAEVLVGPSRTEETYVAALLALQGEEMERERDKKSCQSDKMARASNAILFFELMRRPKESRNRDLGDIGQAMKDLGLSKEDPLGEARNREFFDGFKLSLVYELLRYFRPKLDDAGEKERIELLERTIGYVNEYLKALRRLTDFLQYGETGAYQGLATKRVTQAGKQVQAAELRELVRTERGTPLPYGKIGALLGEKPAPGQADRSYDGRIREMAKLGKGILKDALGEQGYRDYMEERRAELERWKALSKEEQNELQMEENFGIAPEDAYVIVDEQDYRDYMEEKRGESPEKS